MRSITVSVRHVSAATPRTRLIHLDVGGLDLPFAAGQALMVGLKGSPLRKPYSIASAPWEVARTGVLQLLAQVDDSGSPDPHLELAQPGTWLELEGPMGSFGLPDVLEDPSLLFVAGGTGIAPFRSMLMEQVARARVPAMAVVYSARVSQEFAFRSELDALSASGRLRLWLTVTRPDPAWPGRTGRVDASLLRDALPSPGALCLVCGPPGLITDVSAHLRALGVDANRILVEKYQ